VLFHFAIHNTADPYHSALIVAPLFYAGGVSGALSFILLKGMPLPESVPMYVTGLILVGVFVLVALISHFFVVRRVHKWVDAQETLYTNKETQGTISPLYQRLVQHKDRKVEAVFVMLQMMTAPMVAFARGANDVSNGVGPLAAIIALHDQGEAALNLKTQNVAFWVLLVGGLAIALGLFALGRKVIKNIGENITNLTPIRGVCVEVGTAITVMAFSALGVPISSTHTLVGCIFFHWCVLKATQIPLL
jgi:phosphate/sulfate permease